MAVKTATNNFLLPFSSITTQDFWIFSGIAHGRLAFHACVPKRPHFGVQARTMKMIATNELYEW
jgi:hypothetical protein